MPGISDNNVQPINTAPIAAIGSEPIATPALNDFMGAFRSGFITVDDLTRRTKQSAIDTSNLRTTISANDLTRQKTAAELQLLPGQQAEAATQQQIQSITAPGRLAEAGVQTAMSQEKAREFEEYQRSPQEYIAKKTDQLTENTYIQQKGPLPPVLTIKNPEKRPDFTVWAGAPLADAAERGDTATEDRLRTEYLRLFPDEIVVRKGSPEYAMALRDEVNTLAKKGFSSGVHASAYQKGQEAEAVARGTAAGKSAGGGDPEDRAKNEAVIAKATIDSKPIQKYLNAFQSIQQVREVAKQPPSNVNDISILYSYIKSLDPESAVREGEVNLVRAARTIPENILSQWKRLTSDPGFLFTPAQRQEIITSSEKALQGFGAGAAPEVARIKANASALGVDPARAMNVEVLSLVSPTPASPGAGAPTKLPNGTAVAVGQTFVDGKGNRAKWDGFKWTPVQ